MFGILLNNMHKQLNFPAGTDVIDPYEITNRLDKAISAALTPKLDALFGKEVIFSLDEKEYNPIEGWELGERVIPINAINAIEEPTVVVAIDSSCVFVGETAEGIIYSAKCGLAFACMGKPLMHFKMGPMLFYINEEIVRSSNIDKKLWKFILFDTSAAKRMIRVRIERALQHEICKFIKNAIVLVDGSLKKSLLEDESCRLDRILLQCKTNGNQLVGVSKTTRLKVLDKIATSLIRNGSSGYIDVSSIVKSLINNVVGRSLLAKFNGDGSVLRVDVLDYPDEPLGRLIVNDSLHNGYPETLRLAHHLSLFTMTDITCLKSFILSKFSTREMLCEDVRRTLLGAFL